MKRSGGKILPLWFIFLMHFIVHESSMTDTVASASLEIGFYRNSCPLAETIVGKALKKAVSLNPGLGAGLVRMQFHGCFVRRCDASVLIDSTADNISEKDDAVNKHLRGFEVIDEAKAEIELNCPQAVSCADIIAFTARESAFQLGGFRYAVPGGRRDGRITVSGEVDLKIPFKDMNFTELVDSFASKGLSIDEMVILLGRIQLGLYIVRNLRTVFSPSIQLTRKILPWILNLQGSSRIRAPGHHSRATTTLRCHSTLTPTKLDNKDYVDLENNRGLLVSDQILTQSPLTAKLVRKYVKNGSEWAKKFGDAMVHMSSAEVLTGNLGRLERTAGF